MKEIQFPKSTTHENIAINIDKNVVIVGANGAGKTRFGSKIEHINSPTKRISAQRYLTLEDVIPKQDYETASANLSSVYKNKQPTQPQNDYQYLLISLFAQESRRNEDVINIVKSVGSIDREKLPQSVKDRVLEVWNFVFPHRVLKLEKDKIKAVSDADEFSGKEMSDGEKVGLYLISQVLLAEAGCVLIIDEPELHLHKALMVRLWNKLEEQRKDCTFIYITHDLDFAVSKPASKMLWIQNYKNNLWTWVELESNAIIPENLYLEVLGSRKPILFVEGDKGSLDAQLYQVFYNDCTIIPRGSCEKVIESVKGLKHNSELHDKKVYGLIDKDFRPDEQLKAFEAESIFNTKVNKVENLFLLPEIIELICNHLSKKDKKDVIIDKIKNLYQAKKNDILCASLKYQRQKIINEQFSQVKNEADYKAFKDAIINNLDSISVVLPDGNADFVSILESYPNKGLVKEIQGEIELSKNGYQNLVLNLLISGQKTEITNILKKYLPEIQK